MRHPTRLGRSGPRAHTEQLLREPPLDLFTLRPREGIGPGWTPPWPLESTRERVLRDDAVVEGLLDHGAEAATHNVLQVLRRELPVGELGLEPANVFLFEHREREIPQVPDNDGEMAAQI